MMQKEILISVDQFETRVAVLENNLLVECYIEEDEPRILGNIYLGKVKDVIPGMEASFVDIGLDRNAFLFVDELLLREDIESPLPKIQQVLKPGQEILVQVIKEPTGAKGARVSTQLALPGRKLVLLPYSQFLGISRRLDFEERERLHNLCGEIEHPDFGFIVRTAAENSDLADLKEDLDHLLRLWREIEKKTEHTKPPALIFSELDLASRTVRDIFSSDYKQMLIDSADVYKDLLKLVTKTAPELREKVFLYQEPLPLFEKYDVESQLQSGLKRRVWLHSGGYIAIDRSEALTSIDVNTAKYTSGRSLEQTIFKTNLEAAQEIARQLRLRDIGGIIVIDFIDMQELEHRQEVFENFNRALSLDRAKSRVIEISKLGLVQMTRKTLSEGLQGHFFETCPFCGGFGQRISRKRALIEVLRKMSRILNTHVGEAFLFQISPEIATELQGDRVEELSAKTGKDIKLHFSSDMPLDALNLLAEGKKSEVEKYLSSL